jgi:hypothetical protein
MSTNKKLNTYMFLIFLAVPFNQFLNIFVILLGGEKFQVM